VKAGLPCELFQTREVKKAFFFFFGFFTVQRSTKKALLAG
jgi:hypothetical protein